jgi:hypothetical protein
MRFRRPAVASVVLCAWGVLVACGARTGLVFDDTPVIPPPVLTADAALDARADATRPRDAGRDAPLPLIDAAPVRDANLQNCADAEATLVYLISTASDLVSFDPAANAFRRIGTIACGATTGATPFSMAVDRAGAAYVLFNDGNLFRVSTKTAACTRTTFRSGQAGIQTFGMGFAADDEGSGEQLFIAADDSTNVRGLGFIDDNFILNTISPFTPDIARAELTGRGDGRLFAFYERTGITSAIGEIDKRTGNVLAETPLANVEQGTSWAFAFWGGDFYTFTAPQNTNSIVTRIRPSDGSIRRVATFTGQGRIVGAGVSTCAPQQ